MKRILPVVVLILTTFGLSQAQCDRYQSEVFPNVTKTTVTFSSTYNLEMDIYEPTGDSIAERPVILYGFGGSFIGGSKDNPTVVDFCERFAKRGYVTVGYNYRLAGSIADLLDSLSAIDVVMKAVGDAKGAIRYMRQDAATSNDFKIDPDQFFIGGNSAGAIVANHLTYIDNTAEVPSHISTIMDANGGIEGNSGNPGYPSDGILACINWAGAMNSTTWIDSDDAPLFSGHGDNDGTVDYLCNEALPSSAGGFADMVWLCGSGVMHPAAVGVGVDSELRTFPGDGHTPWVSDNDKLDTMINRTSAFIYQYVDCNYSIFTGISNDVKVSKSVNLFPNPATDVLNVHINDYGFEPYTVQLINSIGATVLESNDNSTYKTTLDVNDLPKGTYHLHIQFEDETVAPYSSSVIIK